MAQASPPTIVWLRSDLRLADNPALAKAVQAGGPVVPVYVLDDENPPRPLGGASRWWLDKSLRALDADLRAIGGALVLRRGDSEGVLRGLVAETGARTVVWNRLYDQDSIVRDKTVADTLSADGVECESFNAALLNEPDAVLTGSGGAFKVFTPYFNAALRAVGDCSPRPAPARIEAPARPVASDNLDSWGLHPTDPDWSSGFSLWTPGEKGALRRLRYFLGGAARGYGKGRNLMGEEGVSQLSAHLRFGEIGPRQIWAAAANAAERGEIPRAEAEAYQRELIWREFNYSLLFHNPLIVTEPFNPKFAAFPTRDDDAAFRAWTRGRTGYPVVDAAMRQLWTTGWMHNRARMVAASFLVKDLLIDWRRGEAWFWDTLVDADLANNVANWQWVAGSGADAAPFFRIFNPTLQGEKFDPRGVYVRRWVPELTRLADNVIHKPWTARAEALSAAEVSLGKTYPCPIIDHPAARDRALAAYARLP